MIKKMRGIHRCRSCGRVTRDYAEYERLGMPAPKGTPPKYCNTQCRWQFHEDLEAFADMSGPSILGLAAQLSTERERTSEE